MYKLWEYCKQLANVKWKDVAENENNILGIIRLANQELNKLDTL